MSDKARRSVIRGAVSGVVLFGAIAAGVVLWQGRARLATAQEAPPTQLVREASNAETYAHVLELRGRLGLESEI